MKIGGGNPNLVTLSQSTVKRYRERARLGKTLDLAFSVFDPKLTIHFDGKKLQLGKHQGNEEKKHFPIHVTGASGPKSLGIKVGKHETGLELFPTLISFAYCSYIVFF